MHRHCIQNIGKLSPLRHSAVVVRLGVPRVDDQDATMKAIPGNPPNMAAPPEGCPFRPRCTYAGEDCRVMPPLAPFAEGRARACHRPIAEVTA